jgi:hypothetical protein
MTSMGWQVVLKLDLECSGLKMTCSTAVCTGATSIVLIFRIVQMPSLIRTAESSRSALLQ